MTYCMEDCFWAWRRACLRRVNGLLTLIIQCHEPAIDWKIAPCHKGCFIWTKIANEWCYFIGRPHSSNGLRLWKLFKHLCFALGIVVFQILVNERRMHPSRRNAVTTNAVIDVNEQFSFESKAKSDSENPRVKEWELLLERFQCVQDGEESKWKQVKNIFDLSEH